MADYTKPSVSTHSITLFNEDRTMLKIIYLDDALTVGIYLPQIVDGKASYPKEMRHQVLLNQQNVAALYDAIIAEIMPAFDRGENRDAGVFTNRNKSQMFEAYTQGGSFFVIIHDEIENRIPKNSYVFKFDKTPVIKEYDVNAVSFKIDEVDAQFTLFVKSLEAFANLSNGITAHEYQYRQSYFIDQVRKTFNALNTKFGLGLNTGYGNNGGNAAAGGGFETGNSYNNGSAPSPVQVVQGSMNDLFPGMGDELPFN